MAGTYEKTIDRESAYEKLTQAHGGAAEPKKESASIFSRIFGGEEKTTEAKTELPSVLRRPAGRQPEGFGTTLAKSVVRTVGSSLGREIVRGVLGGIFGGRR